MSSTPVKAGVQYARAEDQRLITGLGQFTADYQYPDMLHMHVIRSMHAHARIQRMDLSAVAAAPGVRWVMTAQDIDAHGGQDLPNAVAVKDRHGEPQRVARMPVLARDTVRFVGQPIAMVIADSAYQAQDAADLADIEFEVLDAVSTMDAALQPGAPVLHEASPGNVSAEFEAGDAAAVEAAFAKARYVSTVRVNSQRLIPAPMEPRAVLAVYDEATDRTRVHTPTQGILGMLGFMSQSTGLPPEKLEILTQDVGGSFGIRGGSFSEHVGVAIAARVLKRPVRWVGSRSEVFVSDWHGRGLSLEGSVALDAEGRLLAIRFHDQVDLGAYNAYMSTFIGTRNLSITMGGVYKVPALYMRSDLVYTNAVPVSAYRGAGRPDIAYAIERLIDYAAHEHGFDPIALRRKNFIAPSEFPYKTANGTVYDTCEFERVLDRALDLSNYAGFSQRREEARLRGKLRGIGLASYLEASGAGGAPKDQVQGEFDEAGVLHVYGVTGASGQGHETSFARIIETELGIAPDRVSYRAGDPQRSLIGNGTGGSRTLYGAGSAIKDMCQRIRLQAQTALAALWQCDVAEIRFDNGAWQRAGHPAQSIHFADLWPQLSAQQRQAFNCIGEAQSGSTFPNGCHVAEIEIDPNTGITEVVSYWAVDDLGVVISPQLVRGQVHGGVVQGWGQAFCEQVVYDDQGQLLSGSFSDYAMPRLGCMPTILNETVQVDTQLNLLGSKGVGESGCSGSLPALANAMMDALRPFGVSAMDMPFTAAKVWAALQAKPH
jgi:carbon-monoxide dehydrogenase large subunit